MFNLKQHCLQLEIKNRNPITIGFSQYLKTMTLRSIEQSKFIVAP